MAAAEIFDKFTKLHMVTYAGVEDFSDRLNFEVTVILLLVCCTTVTLKTYVLSPVACYIPNEVGAHSGQELYVNNYCWTEGTFAVPISEFHIDNSRLDPIRIYRNRRIVYYQWVPFVLGLQSLLFYLPRVLWGMMSYNRAGTDIGHIIRTANDAVTADGEKHSKLVRHVCRRLEQLLFQHSKKHRCGGAAGKQTKMERLRRNFRRLLPSQRLGNWLIFTYFLIKVCYIGNAVGQLYLMHSFLGFNSSYFAFGATVLQNLRRGRDWTQTMIFPRVGACAIYYRAPAGGNYIYSQCTLPINMLNEKIYIFLWFWVIITASLTMLSLPVWVARILLVRKRSQFVRSYLKLADRSPAVDKRDISRFIRDFLRHDGTFLLKMIALNSGDVICTEIVGRLWEVYLRRRYGCADNEDEEDTLACFSLAQPQPLPTQQKPELGQCGSVKKQRRASQPAPLGDESTRQLQQKRRMLQRRQSVCEEETSEADEQPQAEDEADEKPQEEEEETDGIADAGEADEAEDC